MPGPPLDPRAQGCNLLIRHGATLVQSVDDIMEAVRPIDARALRLPVHELEPERGAEAERCRDDRVTPFTVQRTYVDQRTRPDPLS